MSYYYSQRDYEEMIAAGIISDPNKAPSLSDLEFIEKQHKCDKCGESVNYVKDKDKGLWDYHFECTKCDWQGKDAPLKNAK